MFVENQQLTRMIPRLSRSVAEKLVTYITKQQTSSALRAIGIPAKPGPREEGESPTTHSIKSLAHEIVTLSIEHCASAAVSFPLRSLGIRIAAQLVGGEKIYSTWTPLEGVLRIYRDEGLNGLFRGIAPDLIGEVIFVVSTCIFGRLLEKYLTPLMMVGSKCSYSTNCPLRPSAVFYNL